MISGQPLTTMQSEYLLLYSLYSMEML